MPENVKTSLDAAEGEAQENELAAVLEKAGVKDVDELVARSNEYETIKKDRDHNAAERRKLQKQIEDRRRERANDDIGISDDSDPVLKRLGSKLSDVDAKLSKITARLSEDAGDKDLQPYLRQVEVDHPEVMGIDDDETRNSVMLTLARTMRDKEVASGNLDEARREGNQQGSMASRVQFTGGGAGAGRPKKLDDDKVLELLRSDLRGKKPKEQEAIKRAYKEKYPHLF